MTITRNDFLVEIGTEELPPKSLNHLASLLLKNLVEELTTADLAFGQAAYFATPRRIAVLIEHVASSQQEQVIEKTGPAINVAYDPQGKPTPAAIGFAKSGHIAVELLQTIDTPKGKCLYYKQVVPGESLLRLGPDLVKKALNRLPISKPMLWGCHSASFLRPVHWLVMMYGEQIIPGELFELATDNKTHGHRFHAPQAFSLPRPSDYQAVLETKGYVIPCFQKRRSVVQQQIEKLANTKGRPIIDPELLDEVTSLVEWPVALLGSFDSRFLQVPQEALISSMKLHQKSFPIVNEQGNLVPYFITIANIESKDEAEVIIGNERVMRARLADAEFFYHTDLKQGLEKQLAALKTIVFQNKLGTLYDKSTRISELAGFLANRLAADQALACRAGLLCKADLTTEMVGEFPELQGIMGYYYALENQECLAVAQAIQEHYYPRFSGDQVPSSTIGSLIALADKIDTLVGIFGINQAPSGEKDPFGLRRAALGVNRILIENNLPLDLKEVLTVAANAFPQLENQQTVEDTLRFIMERLRTWYLEQHIRADVFASVFARYPTSPLDFDARIKAIQYFQQLPEAEALSAANKRVNNILKQTTYPPHVHFNHSLLELEAEKELGDIIEQKAKVVSELCAHHQYQEALVLLAALRGPIDKFFDQVMVMTEDAQLRNNRLILLNNLRELFLQIADISLLQ